MTWVTNFLKEISTLKRDSSREVFESFKPVLIAHIDYLITAKKKSNAGRPITTSLDIFCNALYHVTSSGLKISSVPELFGIPKSTFLRYFQLLVRSKLLERLYDQLREVSRPSTKLSIIDSFLVKSIDGSETTGRNPCDRGRRGCKVFLVCNANMICQHVWVCGANESENTGLREFIKTSKPVKRVRILGDAGYVGKSVSEECLQKGFRLIAQPRKTRSGGYTHRLNWRDKRELKAERNKIERLNGMVRRYKAVAVKSFKQITSYVTVLLLALILVSAQLLVSKHKTDVAS